MTRDPGEKVDQSAVVSLTNHWWEVEIWVAGEVGPCRVLDRRHGIVVADEHYSYALDVGTGTCRHGSQGLIDVTHARQQAEGLQSVILEGRLDFGASGPNDLFIRHRITL